MDAFQMIQHFFTRMRCQHCHESFHENDVELLRQEEGAYIVNVFCHQCDTQNGVAMVGIETGGADANGIDPSSVEGKTFDGITSGNLPEALLDVLEDMGLPVPEQAGSVRATYQLADPELTEDELERLADFDPISEDDVIEAHRFFKNLDSDWMRLIPSEMRQSQTSPDTESKAV